MAGVELSRKCKKFFLFVSPANKFWESVIPKFNNKENMIADFIGIKRPTFSNWKRSWAIPENSFDDIFDNIEKQLEQSSSYPEKIVQGPNLLNEFKEAFYDKEFNVYDTAKILSLSMEQSQQILDEIIYKRSPLFKSAYYESGVSANRYFNLYKGVYLLWVRRGSKWLQAPMRVRYRLKISDDLTIRCKLNTPVLKPMDGEDYDEYDGFLIGKGERLFWIFERREQNEPYDHFYFITGRGRRHRLALGADEQCLTLQGTYLTVGQDEAKTIEHETVFLQRLSEGTEEEIRTIMHSKAKELSKEESDCVEKCWKEFTTSRR